MEQNFQTSFIPKQSVVETRAAAPRGTGIFTLVAIILFLTMTVASAGVYFYKVVTEKRIVAMENDLNLAKNRFEPAKITQLQELDKRLRAANEVLSKHIAISPIFESLQDITMKSVRFTDFTYSLSDSATPVVNVKMGGEAQGYKAVALQADLFSQARHFIDPVFSNLTLNSKGDVVFNLEFSVEPTFIDYQEALRGASEVPPEPAPLEVPLN
jgi:hypothetical protein